MKLPSGAELTITLAPYEDALALQDAVLEEVRGIKFDPKAEIDVNFRKDMFCVLMSSKKIRAALDPCLKRALYDKKHITKDTFEPVEARQDYISVCMEVAKENILPFLKSLSAEYAQVLESLKSNPV